MEGNPFKPISSLAKVKSPVEMFGEKPGGCSETLRINAQETQQTRSRFVNADSLETCAESNQSSKEFSFLRQQAERLRKSDENNNALIRN